MLGKKRKRILISLLSVALALSCMASTIPAGALDLDQQLDTESVLMSENTDESSFVKEDVSDQDSELESSQQPEDSMAEDLAFAENSVLADEEIVGAEEDSDERVNLALGMKYTGTDAYSEGGSYPYPDTGNKELTDGIYGAQKYTDATYVGYAGGNHETELIFDFGYNQTFDEVKIHYACGASAGVVPPKSVEISYSSDKLNWTEFAVGGPGESGDYAHEYTVTGAPATGRFVKVYIKYGLYWMMLSEVEIMGVWTPRDPRQAVITTDLPTEVNKFGGDTVNLKMDYTIEEPGDEVSIIWKKDNVELPQFKNQKAIKISNAQLSDSGAYQAFVVNRFSDGFEISGDTSACLVTISKSDIEGNDPVVDVPDGDANNLAFGKTYTVSNSIGEDYTDNGKLTDGLYGSAEDYLDGRWVGFSKAKNETAEVIVDLGSAQAFAQVELNFLRDEIADSEWPTKVEVFVSDDKSSWTSAGAFSVKKASTPETMIARAKEKVSGTGRYVKFVMTPGDKDMVLMDEVRVLKASTIPDQGEAELPPNPDAANIAYGKTYTYSYMPSTAYPDTNQRELTDGIHGAGKNYREEEWVGFQVNPPAWAGLPKQDSPVVTLDLGAVESFKSVYIEYANMAGSGINLPDSAKIELSSNGQDWTILAEATSDQFVGGPVLTRFEYTSETDLTARYIRFTSNTSTEWIFMDEIAVMTEVDDNPDHKTPYNIVRDKAYTVSRLPDNGKDGVLTDGRYGVTANLNDPNWVGFLRSKNEANNHVEMVFDLKGMHSVSNITLYSREDSALKLTTPKNLKFYVSNDGVKWTTLKTFNKPLSTFGLEDNTAMSWDSKNPADGFISTKPEYVLPYIGFVKIAFDVPDKRGVYTYIDEVKVEGVYGRTSNAGPCLGDGIDPYNVAIEKTYTLSPEEPDNGYMDNGTKLTDGNRGAYSFADPAWVGFQQAATMTGKQTDRWPFKTLIVDLQEVHSISKIVLSGCSGAGTGRKFAPWSIYMYASMDGENWMPLSRNTSLGGPAGLNNYGWHNPDENDGESFDLTGDENSVYQARYVRVDMELREMNLFDEIEVYGVKGVTDDAKPLTNLTKLENGRDYMKPSEETTNGVKDMVLCYNGWYGYEAESDSFRGDWTPEEYRPYLTYVDENGYVQDTMFDTVCLLGLRSRYGASFTGVWEAGVVKGTAKDWEWYIEKTFKEGGDVDNLNKAAKRASEELGDPNYKVKLVVMFPSIDKLVTNFGSLEGSRNLDFSEEADREYATDWWMDKVFTEMLSGKYPYIEFEGLYELNEQLDFRDCVRYASEKVHSYGDYKYYWIPHYRSCGYMWGKDYGVDCTAFQPNHMFAQPEDEMDFGGGGTKQVETALKIAAYSNIGIELEIDDNLFTRPSWYNLGLDYLNAVVKLGADGDNCYRNWYEGGGTLGKLAASKDATMREFYDNCYQLMRGTYEPREYITEYPSGSDPKRAGFNMDVFYGPGFEDNGTSSGGSAGGSGSIGGGSGGGGNVTPDPDDKPDPETPPTGDENYTWEETDDGYQLTDKDGEIVTGWAKVSGKWYYPVSYTHLGNGISTRPLKKAATSTI